MQRHIRTDSTGIQTTFISKDTVLVTLPHKNILPGSLQVLDESNNVVDTSKIIINYISGQIAGRRSDICLPVNNLKFITDIILFIKVNF